MRDFYIALLHGIIAQSKQETLSYTRSHSAVYYWSAKCNIQRILAWCGIEAHNIVKSNIELSDDPDVVQDRLNLIGQIISFWHDILDPAEDSIFANATGVDLEILDYTRKMLLSTVNFDYIISICGDSPNEDDEKLKFIGTNKDRFFTILELLHTTVKSLNNYSALKTEKPMNFRIDPHDPILLAIVNDLLAIEHPKAKPIDDLVTIQANRLYSGFIVFLMRLHSFYNLDDVPQDLQEKTIHDIREHLRLCSMDTYELTEGKDLKEVIRLYANELLKLM